MANQFGKIIKRAMPAVVSVTVTRSLEAVEKEIPKDAIPFLPYEDSHLKVPDEHLDEHGMVKVGGGSGFFVDDSGIILTNKHVVSASESKYTVLTSTGERLFAEVVASDPIDDVAILKVVPPKGGVNVISLGDSSKVELGETVLAFGNALGLFQNTVSSGIISGLERSIRANPDPKKPSQELRGLIQTDAAINPGNSGGPLINMLGKVIGINTAVVAGAQNLGFAIPINAAKRDLSDLKKYGKIKRPFLGLRYLTIDHEVKEKMKLPVEYGALVMGKLPKFSAVVSGSPAQKAGLQERDIVLECNGERITHDHTIQDVLENEEAGAVLRIKFLRGGKERDSEIVLAERK